MTDVEILHLLRSKEYIIERNDGKFTGSWDGKVLHSTHSLVNRGLIELVDRKRDDGTTYPAYVISDKGREYLETHG